MTKIKEIFRIIFNKTEKGEVKLKEKWSLKKKLLLAGGVLAGVAVGIFTYGKAQENDYDSDDEFEDEDFEFDYASEAEDLNDEEETEVEVETQL